MSDWFINRRQEFIEATLRQFGQINREDLVREFGISMQLASADLSRFMARGLMRYDVSAKTYVFAEQPKAVVEWVELTDNGPVVTRLPFIDLPEWAQHLYGGDAGSYSLMAEKASPGDCQGAPVQMSRCDRCGAEYPSAAPGVIHKCTCSGGMMKRIEP